MVMCLNSFRKNFYKIQTDTDKVTKEQLIQLEQMLELNMNSVTFDAQRKILTIEEEYREDFLGEPWLEKTISEWQEKCLNNG